MNGKEEKDAKIRRIIEKNLEKTPSIVTEYFHYLEKGGKTYRTMQTYLYNIEGFIDYEFGLPCKDECFYRLVTAETIRNYLLDIEYSTKSDGEIVRTTRTHMATVWSSLNSFFEYLVPMRLEHNPVSEVPRPKVEHNEESPNEYLTKDEMQVIMENVLQKGTPKCRMRDYCLLVMGFTTGMRISEICNLNVDDIDMQERKIRIINKKGKAEYVSFGFKLRRVLMAWLKDREQMYKTKESNALFLSQEDKRLSVRTVKDILDRYCDIVSKHVTAQTMRDSCIAYLYQQTGSVQACAEQLRLKDAATAQRYIDRLGLDDGIQHNPLHSMLD